MVTQSRGGGGVEGPPPLPLPPPRALELDFEFIFLNSVFFSQHFLLLTRFLNLIREWIQPSWKY